MYYGYDYNYHYDTPGNAPGACPAPARGTGRRTPTAVIVAIEVLAALVVLAAVTLVLTLCGVIGPRTSGAQESAVIEAPAEAAATIAPIAVTDEAEPAQTELVPDDAELYAEPVTAVVSEALNLRRGPDTTYDVIDVLAAGESLSVLAERGDWAWVDRGGVQGWVCTDYITRTA